MGNALSEVASPLNPRCCCSTRPKPNDEVKPLAAGRRMSDADKFDVAFEKNDIAQFVRLMDSDEPIEEFAERMHPWAADPRTVGALAGTQLAILCSIANEETASRKAEILAAGALPKFLAFLADQNRVDRVQTAVVALSFLTTEHQPCAVEAQRLGCMKLMVPHLSSEEQGMRAAAASTLRNLYVESSAAKAQFLQLGGVAPLIQDLTSEANADLVLETLLNIEDLLDPDLPDPKVAEALLAAGATAALQHCAKGPDADVRANAAELLEKLQVANKSA